MKKRLFTLLTLMLCLVGTTWAAIGDTCTVFLTSNPPSQSKANYFTVSGSINYNTAYKGTYKGTAFLQGLKMQGDTKISFTTEAQSTITVVQCKKKNSDDHSSRYIKLDGTVYNSDFRTEPTTSDMSNVLVYTIPGISAGSHSIVRENSEIGIVYVKVEYTGENETLLEAPTISYTASTGEVTIDGGSNVYYTTDGTDPKESETKQAYSKPFTVTDGTVVTAASIGETDKSTVSSSAVSETVILTGIGLSAPEIVSVNGTVAITCANPNVTIEYSTDGTTYSTYKKPFTLTADATVYARVSRTDCTGAEANTSVTALPANTKTGTIYMGYGSFSKNTDSKTDYSVLTGADGDDAEGYSLTLSGNIEKNWSSTSQKYDFGGDISNKTFIKLSNGAQNTLTLPDGVKATRITFYSYMVGTSENESGWKEVNGKEDNSYTSIPMGSTSNSDPDVRIFPLDNVTGKITFTNGGAQLGFIIALDVIEESKTVSVGDDGVASFSCKRALDFTNVTDVAAYVATACDATTGSVTMTQVKQVPAKTGLILKSKDGSACTASVPVLESADAPKTNYLVAVTTKTTVAKGTDINNYVFGKKDSQIGFYLIDSKSATISAGKAYLATTTDLTASSESKAVTLNFGDETTGIENVKTVKGSGDGAFYTLSGVRVAKPAKGLYIVNGKKVIVK